jgi:hypothetical protein
MPETRGGCISTMGIPAIKTKGPVFGRMTAEQYRGIGREDDLRDAVVQWLTVKGIVCSVTDSALVMTDGEAIGRATMQPGWPDITACLAPTGRLVAIELKSRGGRLRPAQISTLEKMRAAGALVLVVKDLREVIEAIEGCK